MADRDTQRGDLSGKIPARADSAAPGDDSPGSTFGKLAAACDRVLENLGELEPALVNAGVFDRDHEPVASTSGSASWANQAGHLLREIQAGAGADDVDSAHVASADGEVFVVRESGLSLVAVTGRFVLASLTAYDMRMALRDAIRESSGAGGETFDTDLEPSPGAENEGASDA